MPMLNKFTNLFKRRQQPRARAPTPRSATPPPAYECSTGMRPTPAYTRYTQEDLLEQAMALTGDSDDWPIVLLIIRMRHERSLAQRAMVSNWVQQQTFFPADRPETQEIDWSTPQPKPTAADLAAFEEALAAEDQLPLRPVDKDTSIAIRAAHMSRFKPRFKKVLTKREQYRIKNQGVDPRALRMRLDQLSRQRNNAI